MEELITKISDLFLKYGVKSVTMDDLAKELGISKKTLYLSFADKKDVVMKFVEYSIARHQSCLIKAKEIVDGSNAIDNLLKVSQLLINSQNKINTICKSTIPKLGRKLNDLDKSMFLPIFDRISFRGYPKGYTEPILILK